MRSHVKRAKLPGGLALAMALVFSSAFFGRCGSDEQTAAEPAPTESVVPPLFLDDFSASQVGSVWQERVGGQPVRITGGKAVTQGGGAVGYLYTGDASVLSGYLEAKIHFATTNGYVSLLMRAQGASPADGYGCVLWRLAGGQIYFGFWNLAGPMLVANDVASSFAAPPSVDATYGCEIKDGVMRATLTFGSTTLTHEYTLGTNGSDPDVGAGKVGFQIQDNTGANGIWLEDFKYYKEKP